MDHSFPSPRSLKTLPDRTLVRVTLGLTVYLADSRYWSDEPIARFLEGFFEAVPREELRWYCTSRMDRWRPVDDQVFADLRVALPLGRGKHLRHGFLFQIADEPGAAKYSFRYRELDDGVRPRSSWVQVNIGPDADPHVLTELALSLANAGPIRCGVGGYHIAWGSEDKPTAFWEAFEWSRRYLGLDIQDPDPMAFAARKGLAGVNWLTLVGNALAEDLELDLSELAEGAKPAQSTIFRAPYGVVIRASEQPTTGDSNWMSHPRAYGELARWLSPFFLDQPPGFFGGFVQEERTRRWYRRLIDPWDWQG